MARDTDDTAATYVPTSVRLPSEMRDELSREASKNQRTLSHEIVKRLADSLEGKPAREPAAAHLSARAARMNTDIHHAQGVEDGGGTYRASSHSPHEVLLLSLFGQMQPERQLALLTLLRGA